MRRLALLIACALPFATPNPARAASPEARALVERVVRAYGGRGALARVHAYRIDGDVFSSMRHVSAPTVRIFERPNRFKALINYADAPEGRLLDGERGWRNEHGGALEPASGPMLGAMVLQAARADVPWILVEHAADAVTIAPVEHDGVQMPGLEIDLGDGLTFRAYVHPVTYLLGMSQGLLDMGGMRTHFETWYSQFEQVNGVRFAFHEENWASGVQTGVTTVRSVSVNPKLRADEFTVPVAVSDSARTRGE